MGEDKIIADLAKRQHDEVMPIIHKYLCLSKNAKFDSRIWKSEILFLASHLIAGTLKNKDENMQDVIMNMVSKEAKNIAKNSKVMRFK